MPWQCSLLLTLMAADEERYYVSKVWVNSWKKSGDTQMDTKLNTDLVHCRTLLCPVGSVWQCRSAIMEI